MTSSQSRSEGLAGVGGSSRELFLHHHRCWPPPRLRIGCRHAVRRCRALPSSVLTLDSPVDAARLAVWWVLAQCEPHLPR